ncbi:type II secretion system protein GspK [Solilutibacter silvestris]|uniref:type II secretion system protein GspK n=1 Tax=Solilutibacter silvestris TaxID=1645665 RepID=UPI0013FD5557
MPLVLWLIAIMTTAIALLAMSASNRHLQSSTLGDRVAAEAAARAGINYAVARMDARLGAQRWLPDGQPRKWDYDGYELTIVIRDEWGKFDLNAGDPDVLRALMQLDDMPPDEMSAVIEGLGVMRTARLSRQEGMNDAGDMPTHLFTVASLSQLRGVSPEILARLAPELTVYSGRSLPDMGLADARMRTALMASGKAVGTPVGIATGSGLYDIDVTAIRPGKPPGRVWVVLQQMPRYDGGIEIKWLAWGHGVWQ